MIDVFCYLTALIRICTIAAVLKRDGTNIVTNSSSCAVTSGEWVSPYDNVPTTIPADLDIVCHLRSLCLATLLIIIRSLQDHLVPLKEVNNSLRS